LREIQTKRERREGERGKDRKTRAIEDENRARLFSLLSQRAM
jgi:hypothetical protein